MAKKADQHPSSFPEIATMDYEQAMSELEKIVSQLESGGGKLEDSIKQYEKGSALQKHCELKLSEAENKVEKITLGSTMGSNLGADGLNNDQPPKITLSPFDPNA